MVIYTGNNNYIENKKINNIHSRKNKMFNFKRNT